jgi:hypothetical protein
MIECAYEKYILLSTFSDMNGLMAKQALFSLGISSLIWCFQFKVVSRVSNKNCILFIVAISLLLHNICILVSLFALVVICKKDVLSQFNVSRLLWNHLFTLLNTSLTLCLSSLSSWFVIMKLASSANRIGMDLSDILSDKSFISIKNSNGLSTEPCGLQTN